MDELRYYIMSRPQKKAAEPKKGAIQIDKERLAKRLERERARRRYV